MKIRHTHAFATLTAVFFASACGGSDTGDASRALPTIPPSAEVVAAASETVVITPSTVSIQVGSSVQFTAKAYNSLGQLRGHALFDWKSSNTGIATVDTSGKVLGLAAGSSTITATTRYSKVSSTAIVTVTSPTPPPPPPPPTGTQTLIAAGDIAVCTTTYDEATANLVDNIPGTVAVLGDNAYPDGTAADYANCYGPTWGRHKARTRPAIGNHEYVRSSNGAGYWGYFGAAAGTQGQGWYSYDLGAWHIIVLNSNCGFVGCTVGSPQETWLKADLAATTKACILAYWHHPLFSSDGNHGGNSNVLPFWNALYQAKADLVLNGHTHVYERFGLQSPTAVADQTNGIRQFTVATGGKSPFYNWGTIKANSQVRQNQTHGVLKLTLGATSYSWNFVPVAGKTWTDSGTQACH